MDKGINKKLMSKVSSKNIKLKKKSLKNKESLLASARTPRSGQFKIDLINYPPQFKTLKTIPTVTYRDIQTTHFPSQIHQNLENLSYLNHTQSRLEPDLYSSKHINVKTLLSDRRVSKSPSNQRQHQSLVRKPKNSEKNNQKKESLKRQKTKQRRNTTLNLMYFSPEESPLELNPKLQQIFKRTSKLLTKYRVREQKWKNEKQQLLKELEKYKRKNNGKSIATTVSSHNSQSHKLLV